MKKPSWSHTRASLLVAALVLVLFPPVAGADVQLRLDIRGVLPLVYVDLDQQGDSMNFMSTPGVAGLACLVGNEWLHVGLGFDAHIGSPQYSGYVALLYPVGLIEVRLAPFVVSVAFGGFVWVGLPGTLWSLPWDQQQFGAQTAIVDLALEYEVSRQLRVGAGAVVYPFLDSYYSPTVMVETHIRFLLSTGGQ